MARLILLMLLERVQRQLVGRRHGRVVNVTAWTRCIERIGVGGVEWGPGFPPGGKVRVGQKGPAHSNQVGFVRHQISLGPRRVIAAAENQVAFENATKHVFYRLRHYGRAHGGMVNQMDVVQRSVGELLRQIGVVGRHVFVQGHVVEDAERGQANANPIFANRHDHRFDHLQRKTCPVFNGAAIGVGALIRGRANELLHQVAVGSV